MNKSILNILLAAVLLVPAQGIIFNHLILFHVAIPLVFIYVIVNMPVTLGTCWAMTIAFLTGLGVDIFSDTLGLNALACTVLAFVRKPVYHLYMPIDDDLAGQCPGLRTMGAPAYLKYLITMTVIYCTLVFVIEAFQFVNIGLMLQRICFSSALTFVIVYALNTLSFRTHRREKKL